MCIRDSLRHDQERLLRRLDVVPDGDVADRDPVATAEGVDRDLLDAAVVDRHEVSGGTRGGLTDIAATGDDLDDEVLTLAGAVDDELVAAGAVGDRDPGSGRPEQRHADRVGSVERRQTTGGGAHAAPVPRRGGPTKRRSER